MLDYVNLLLDAINKYNEDDVDSKNRLRDLVCIISENDSVKSDPLIKELLYTASHKMRILGTMCRMDFINKKILMKNIYRNYRPYTIKALLTCIDPK